MWFLEFLSLSAIFELIPFWVFLVPVALGLLGLVVTFLMKFIPFVYVYRSPIQLISIVLIAIGTFATGAKFNDMLWVAKAEEMKRKIAEAEAKSKEENVKIVEKVVIKTQIVKEQNEQINRFIDTEVSKHDERFAPGGQCELPKDVIKAINDAARSVK